MSSSLWFCCKSREVLGLGDKTIVTMRSPLNPANKSFEYRNNYGWPVKNLNKFEDVNVILYP